MLNVGCYVDRTYYLKYLDIERKTTIEANENTFSNLYPNFRLLTIICIVYWLILLLKLFSRNDLEIGDAFSFLGYSIFLFTHVVILLATYISDNFNKGQKVIFCLSILPFIITGIVMTISLLGFLAMILKTIFNGH